jgi:hypothetical protein
MDRWKYFHWCVSRGAGGRSKNPHRFRSNSSSTHPRQWTDFCVGFSFRCDATIRRCSRPRYAVFEEHVFCRLRYLPVTIYCNERERRRDDDILASEECRNLWCANWGVLPPWGFVDLLLLRWHQTTGFVGTTVHASFPYNTVEGDGWKRNFAFLSSSRIALSSGCIASVLPTRCPGPSFHPVIPWLISGSRKTCVFTWRGEEKGD